MPKPQLEPVLDLVRAYRARRDGESLDRLFRACYPLVLRIVELRLRRRLRGDQEAEDLAQDSLLDVLRSLKYFATKSEGAFRNWLATIVENNLRDREKRARAAKRSGRPVLRFSDLPATGPLLRLVDEHPPPGAELAASELEERIQRAMAELEEPYREVLILRRLCNLSYTEIATTVGYIGASSARSAYTRAMTRLRNKLGPSVRRPSTRRKA
jgi:RNA polymerase sigma-70 factor (ECF subfamily)